MTKQIRKFVLVGLIVLGALGCESEEHLQQVNRESSIVGGSTFDALPAVGLIAYNGQVHCTGTVIGPRLVLTAGHCVSGYSASRMQFLIGASLQDYDYVLPVASIQAHPYYDGYNIRNDIGVVRLAQDAPVAPMGVLKHMDSSWTGTELLFVGYGVSNGYYHSGSGVKRAVRMPIEQVGSTQFSYGLPGKNTCSGDSGGPAFYIDSQGNYLVAGVTSYGDAYCASYGVDTRVDAYLDFLNVAPADPDDPVDPVDPVDPCRGETYEGRCDGSTVIWCENQQVKSVNCRYGCDYNYAKSYYDCVYY